MPEPLISLSQLAGNPTEGHKARLLSELYQKGANILPAWLLPGNYLLKQLVKADEVRKSKPIFHLLDGAGAQQGKHLSVIKKRLNSLPLSSEMSHQLDQVLSKNQQAPLIALSISVPASLKPSYLFEKIFQVKSATSSDQLYKYIKQTWFRALELWIQTPEFSPNQLGYLNILIQHHTVAEWTSNTFSRNPATLDERDLWVEAVRGVWHSGVIGRISPETYLVDSQQLSLKTCVRNHQTEAYLLYKGQLSWQPISKAIAHHPLIHQHLLKQLASEVVMLRRYYNQPVRVQHTYHQGKLYITNVTLLQGTKNPVKRSSLIENNVPKHPVVWGRVGYPGQAVGRILVLSRRADYDQIKPGHIVVVKRFFLDKADRLSKSAAVITAKPSFLSYEAIVATQLKRPSLLGASQSLSKLTSNQVVSLDASRGVVYLGKIDFSKLAPTRFPNQLKTGLELFGGDQATHLAHHKITGPILIDANMLYQHYLRTHPKRLTPAHLQKQLGPNLEAIAQVFVTNQLIYKGQDLDSQALSRLPHSSSSKVTQAELALPGLETYLQDREMFEKDLGLVALLKRKTGPNRLAYAMPGVYSTTGFKRIAASLKRRLGDTPTFVVIGNLSSLFILETLLSAGASGCMVDLGQITSGVGSSARQPVSTWLTDNDPYGLVRALTLLVNICKRHQVPLWLRQGEIYLSTTDYQFLVTLGLDQIIVPSYLYK